MPTNSSHSITHFHINTTLFTTTKSTPLITHSYLTTLIFLLIKTTPSLLTHQFLIITRIFLLIITRVYSYSLLIHSQIMSFPITMLGSSPSMLIIHSFSLISLTTPLIIYSLSNYSHSITTISPVLLPSTPSMKTPAKISSISIPPTLNSYHTMLY